MTGSIPPPTTWRELPGRFALVGLERGALGPTDLAHLADLVGEGGSGQLLWERDEVTCLVPERELPRLRERWPEARVQGGLVWFRFEAAMEWDVVGFLARVTTALAAAQVPVGALCGYSRDSVFLANPYRDRARAVLTGLFPESA